MHWSTLFRLPHQIPSPHCVAHPPRIDGLCSNRALGLIHLLFTFNYRGVFPRHLIQPFIHTSNKVSGGAIAFKNRPCRQTIYNLVEWHSCTEYDLFWVMRGRGKVQHFWSRHPKNSKISTSCRSVQVCKKCNALWWFLLITRSESAPFLPHESRSVPPSLHRPLSRSQTAKMPLPPFFSQPFKVWHRAGNVWYSF